MNDEHGTTSLSHESDEVKDLKHQAEPELIRAVESKDAEPRIALEPQLINILGTEDHNERFEPQLIHAVESDDVGLIHSIINKARHNGKLDDNILSMALMRGCEKGKVKASECLLQLGANPGGTSETTRTRLPPLLRAVDKGHIDVVRLLFKYGATPDAHGRTGKTALMMAALQNSFHIVELLLKEGADPNKKDSAGRNVLHIMAMDKQVNYGLSLIARLLEIPNISIDERNELNRTPLHWACSTGNLLLAEALLEVGAETRANINAIDNRGKSSLHLAAHHDRIDIVAMLLKHGADANMASDGGWTPLHVACEKGWVDVVDLLLGHDVEVNAKLVTGMSPLHLAAQGGHIAVVRRLLRQEQIEETGRDIWGRTPFLAAAQGRNHAILNLLAPRIDSDDLSKDFSKTNIFEACKGFKATIVDFGDFHNGNRVQRKTIYELLYAPDVGIVTDAHTNFRWIHLPANNIAWADALFKKLFVQDSGLDVQALEALERSLSQLCEEQQSFSQHKPAFGHELRVSDSKDDVSADSTSGDEMNPMSSTVLSKPRSKEPAFGGHQNPNVVSKPSFAFKRISKITEIVPEITPRQKDLGKKETDDVVRWQGTEKVEKGNEAELEILRTGSPIAVKVQRHVRRRPRTDYERNPSAGSVRRFARSITSEDVTVTFLSYLHFETQLHAHEMQRAIKHAQVRQGPILPSTCIDEALINGYLTSKPTALHARRLLDPSISQKMNLESHDAGQDYRGEEPLAHVGTGSKVLMADQLWMWTLGPGMIVTAFPQRWKQPRNDPSNVVEAIIASINHRSRNPMRSVFDLSVIIVTHCLGALRRHKTHPEDFHFRDKFESFIRTATDREHWLAENSKTVSAQAYAWLRYQGSDDGHTAWKKSKIDGLTLEAFYTNKLLDTRQESDLIAEIASITHQMSLVIKLLRDQLPVLSQLGYNRGFRSSGDRRGENQIRNFLDLAETQREEIALLDDIYAEAWRIFNSLKNTLEIKKQHATAFEACFFRGQALKTARQTQLIAILTLIFLPLSFVAMSFVQHNMHHIVKASQRGLSLALGQVNMYLLTFAFPLVGFTYITAFYDLADVWCRGASLWTWGERPRSSNLVHQAETEVSRVDVPSTPPSMQSPDTAPPTISRLTWTCHCGHESYDEFTELTPTGLQEMANELQISGFLTAASVTTRNPSNIETFISRLSTRLSELGRYLGRLIPHWWTSKGLPISETRAQTTIPYSHPPRQDCKFLHICIEKGRYSTRLHHFDVCDKTDRAIFKTLRKDYKALRREMNSMLYKIRRIDFVEFQIYPKSFVDSIVPDQLPPPPPENTEYEYLPAPARTKPPIGGKFMMHMWHCKEAVPEKDFFSKRFPKKMREPCQFTWDDSNSANVGWGLHIVEGLSFALLVWIMFAFTAVAGLVFGISWTIMKDDVSGAYTVASYITALMTLLLMAVMAVITGI